MKIFTSIIFTSLLVFTLGAQQIEVPENQRPLITKRTADWCTFCGTWGWNLFEGLLDDNTGKALLIAAHYSGGLVNPASDALTNNFGGFGQPLFFYNNENQNANSSNYPSVRESIGAKVSAATQELPLAQTGILAAWNEGALSVYTRTRFFQAAEGEYVLGIYLIEKKYIGYQSSQGQNAEHRQLLREHLTADPFGELLATGAITAGTETDIQVSFDLGNYDPNNIEIATIIWEKNGEQYKALNTNFTSDLIDGVISRTEDLLSSVDMDVAPNPMADRSLVSFKLPVSAAVSELILLDQQGRTLAVLHRGQLTAGMHQFSIDRDQTPSAGTYFLRLQTGKSISIRKLLVTE